MSDDLDELDAALRRAMAALDGEAPAGYFEALPERTLARLDDPAIGELPDDPGRKDRRDPASEPRVRPIRAMQDRPPPADDDGAVFSSQIMAAVELPEPAGKRVALPRGDRASASSVITVLPVPPGADPATDAVASRSPSAVPAASSAVSAGPVEAPASAAASMALAGSPGRRRSRRVRAAIVGIGGIGLAAVAVIYLAVGDRAPRSDPSIVSHREPAAQASAPVASPSAGGSTSVSSVAAGSAASGSAAGSAAIAPAGAGSGAAQDNGSGAMDKPVAKFPGALGKRPGNVKSLSKGGGGKLETQLPDQAAGKAAGKKIKSSKPRPDRTSLSGDDIERAMTAVAGKARACFAGTRGTVSLRLTVAPSGRIAQATVTGPFAGSPAGACLERAVQAATFPPWSGAPQSFDYSYPLSD